MQDLEPLLYSNIFTWPKSEYCKIEGDIAKLFSTLQEML